MSKQTMSFKVQGMEEINRKLKALRELGVKPKHIIKVMALKAGAKPIADEAKSLAPDRRAGVLFGRSKKSIMNTLRRSLTGQRPTTKKIERLASNVQKGKSVNVSFLTLKKSIGTKFSAGVSRDDLAIRILTRKSTGHLIEFGHRTKQGTGKSKYYKPKPGGKSSIEPHPFLAPAITAASDRSVARVAEVINKELDKLIAEAR